MSNKFLIIGIVVFLTTITVALAAYDRHDGSQYSCNEIRTELAYAKKHHDVDPAPLRIEYTKYCGWREKK